MEDGIETNHLQGHISGGDECANFEPSVLVFKPLIPDCDFDHLQSFQVAKLL